jgi:hypothetical protein
MMEAVRTYETSVDNYFTRQYIPEDNSEHRIMLPRRQIWGMENAMFNLCMRTYKGYQINIRTVIRGFRGCETQFTHSCI